jgi:hypothetical protein
VSHSPLCILVYRREERPDAAITDAVARLQRDGFDVRGLLQEGTEGSTSGCATLFLEDIGSGRRVEIFQNRGRETRGCRLDASGLAEAAAWLREAIESRPEVLVLNRFGRQEAEGGGLGDEIAAAVVAGIPVIVPVNEMLLPEWDAFSGGTHERMPADPDKVVQWCRTIVAAPA